MIARCFRLIDNQFTSIYCSFPSFRIMCRIKDRSSINVFYIRQCRITIHQVTCVSSQEFTDIVAISQMTPGPIGINAATYVGFTSTGSVWGSVIATFAVVLPSFILMLTISKFFLKYQKHPVVESIFNGLRPAVVGLLASAALVLMNVENFGSPTEDTYSFVISIIIFLIAFIGTRKYKANPILMIIACGIAGLLLY